MSETVKPSPIGMSSKGRRVRSRDHGRRERGAEVRRRQVPLDAQSHRLHRRAGGRGHLLAVKAADDLRQFVVVTLNGVTLAALYFVVASGFTLIFGLMRVVNMAHGSLYLLGGYLALKMQESWFQEETGLNLSLSGATDAEYGLMGWLVPLVLATLIIGFIGVGMQQVFLRWNQGQDLRQALITIALSVIIADQMLAAFGGISKDIATPAAGRPACCCRATSASASSAAWSSSAALLIGVLLVLVIKRTRFGKIVRAGVDDRDMVSALGINVQLVFLGAFFLGAMLAGFGGVLGGTMISLAPGQDAAFLLNSLIVVIIGGWARSAAPRSARWRSAWSTPTRTSTSSSATPT